MMKSWIRIVWLGVASMTLNQCATKPPQRKETHSAQSPPSVPKELHTHIGGFFGPSMSVELAGPSTVIYKQEKRGFIKDSTPGEKVKISPEKWAAFRSELDQARVWKWKPEYINRNVSDGTGWEFKATYDDRKIDSSGLNAYPPPADFSRVQAAVRDLVGKPFH
jgi:hypothetical protein